MRNCLAVVVLFLSGCIYDPPDSILSIINNTNQTFSIILKVDTVPTLSGYGVPFYTKVELLSQDTLELTKPANSWVQLMRRHSKNNLYLFIPYQTLKVDSTKKQYKVISYTEKELEELNWQIVINNKQ